MNDFIMTMPITQELVEKKYYLYHSLINDALGKCFDRENPVTLYACLLYTSPSPRDRQKSRMPSSA